MAIFMKCICILYAANVVCFLRLWHQCRTSGRIHGRKEGRPVSIVHNMNVNGLRDATAISILQTRPSLHQLQEERERGHPSDRRQRGEQYTCCPARTRRCQCQWTVDHEITLPAGGHLCDRRPAGFACCPAGTATWRQDTQSKSVTHQRAVHDCKASTWVQGFFFSHI